MSAPSEFPECMRRRGEEFIDGEGGIMNGQICHRIAFHTGHCVFDRPPEFDPPRTEARPLPRPAARLALYSPVPPRLVPNPAAEA